MKKWRPWVQETLVIGCKLKKDVYMQGSTVSSNLASQPFLPWLFYSFLLFAKPLSLDQVPSSVQFWFLRAFLMLSAYSQQSLSQLPIIPGCQLIWKSNLCLVSVGQGNC